MKYPVCSLDDGRQIGEVELDDSVFAIENIRRDILHRMVCYQMAKRRRGTRKTQTRSEVSARSGKAHSQKRTGRARHGSRNSPLFVGGAVAHGPRVRSHATKLPRKVRAMAMRHALSARRRDGALTVVCELNSDSGKTGDLRRHLVASGAEKALIVGEASETFRRAAANLATIDVVPEAGLNVYDVLRCERLVLTSATVASVQQRLSMAGTTGT